MVNIKVQLKSLAYFGKWVVKNKKLDLLIAMCFFLPAVGSMVIYNDKPLALILFSVSCIAFLTYCVRIIIQDNPIAWYREYKAEKRKTFDTLKNNNEFDQTDTDNGGSSRMYYSNPRMGVIVRKKLKKKFIG